MKNRTTPRKLIDAGTASGPALSLEANLIAGALNNDEISQHLLVSGTYVAIEREVRLVVARSRQPIHFGRAKAETREALGLPAYAVVDGELLDYPFILRAIVHDGGRSYSELIKLAAEAAVRRQRIGERGFFGWFRYTRMRLAVLLAGQEVAR